MRFTWIPRSDVNEPQRRLSRAAFPAPCCDRTRACHATDDEMETVGVSPNLHAMLPLTRYGTNIGGRMGDTRPLTRGLNKNVSAENGE